VTGDFPSSISKKPTLNQRQCTICPSVWLHRHSTLTRLLSGRNLLRKTTHFASKHNSETRIVSLLAYQGLFPVTWPCCLKTLVGETFVRSVGRSVGRRSLRRVWWHLAPQFVVLLYTPIAEHTKPPTVRQTHRPTDRPTDHELADYKSLLPKGKRFCS
jgi:hypothetical protein